MAPKKQAGHLGAAGSKWKAAPPKMAPKKKAHPPAHPPPIAPKRMPMSKKAPTPRPPAPTLLPAPKRQASPPVEEFMSEMPAADMFPPVEEIMSDLPHQPADTFDDWGTFDEVLLGIQKAHDMEVTQLTSKVEKLEKRIANPWKMKAAQDAEYAAMRCEIIALRHENSELHDEFACEFGPREDGERFSSARAEEVAAQLAESASQAARAAVAADAVAGEAETLRGLWESAMSENAQLQNGTPRANGVDGLSNTFSWQLGNGLHLDPPPPHLSDIQENEEIVDGVSNSDARPASEEVEMVPLEHVDGSNATSGSAGSAAPLTEEALPAADVEIAEEVNLTVIDSFEIAEEAEVDMDCSIAGTTEQEQEADVKDTSNAEISTEVTQLENTEMSVVQESELTCALEPPLEQHGSSNGKLQLTYGADSKLTLAYQDYSTPSLIRERLAAALTVALASGELARAVEDLDASDNSHPAKRRRLEDGPEDEAHLDEAAVSKAKGMASPAAAPEGLSAKFLAARPPQSLSGDAADSAKFPSSSKGAGVFAKSMGMPSSKSSGMPLSKSMGVPPSKSNSMATSKSMGMSKAKSFQELRAKSAGGPMAKRVSSPPAHFGMESDDDDDSEEWDDSMPTDTAPRFEDLILALQQAHMNGMFSARSEYTNSLMGEAEDEFISRRSEEDKRSRLLKITDAPNFLPMDPHFKSTADSWNRLRDKARVEGQLRLREQGDSTTVFVDPKDPRVVVGRGYQRVLYGDHGPYVEFAKHHVRWAAFPKVKIKGPYSYYHEHYTRTNSVKVYEQRKTVGDKPNPPPGMWTCRNNRVATGYADYQPNVIYMACDSLQVVRHTSPCLDEMNIDIDGLFPPEGESLLGPGYGPVLDAQALREGRQRPSQALSWDSPINQINTPQEMASPEELQEDFFDDQLRQDEQDYNDEVEVVEVQPTGPRETLEDVERAMRADVDDFVEGHENAVREKDKIAQEALAAVLTGFSDGMPPDLQGQLKWLEWPLRFATRLGGSSYKAFVEKQSELVLVSCPKPYRFIVLPEPRVIKLPRDFWESYWLWCHEELFEAPGAETEPNRAQLHDVKEMLRKKSSEAGFPADEFDAVPKANQAEETQEESATKRKAENGSEHPEAKKAKTELALVEGVLVEVELADVPSHKSAEVEASDVPTEQQQQRGELSPTLEQPELATSAESEQASADDLAAAQHTAVVDRAEPDMAISEAATNDAPVPSADVFEPSAADVGEMASTPLARQDLDAPSGQMSSDIQKDTAIEECQNEQHLGDTSIVEESEA